jgi:membrane protease YdiL (CAAX protease family)
MGNVGRDLPRLSAYLAPQAPTIRGERKAMGNSFVMQAVVTVAVSVVAISPFLLVAIITGRTRRRMLLLVVAAVLVLDMTLAMAPSVGPFRGLTWNWQGKLLETIVTIFVAAVIAGVSLRDLGLRYHLQPASARPVWTAALLCTAGAAVPVSLGTGLPLTWGTLLFQATLPGLSEELVYRGAMQSLLDRVFDRPWKLLGASLGWGSLLPALYFTALHVLHVGTQGSMTLSPGGLPSALILGLMLAWMRERSGSVWPGVVAHNGFDTLLVVGPPALAWVRGLLS